MNARVPVFTNPEQGSRLRGSLRRAGFEERTLLRRYDAAEPVAPGSTAEVRLAPLATSEQPADVLATLFLMGHPLPKTKTVTALGPSCVDDLLEVGLVREEGGDLTPQASLAAHGQVIVAADLYPAVDPVRRRDPADQATERGASEHVLTLSPVARHLLRLARPQHVGCLLDLCAGNGIQGLAAAARAARVVLTDLNPRALEFARFNCVLNGAANVECRYGNGFDPVRGERFDQIVCNPPFILTPTFRLIATSNDRELDNLCRDLIREAPDFLEDGGCFQMVFEWAEIEGQSPRARVSSWCEGLPCDAWLFEANMQRPGSYAAARVLEMRRVSGPDTPEIGEWLDYYVRHRVVAIHGGALVLRKRAQGPGWFRVEQLESAPTEYAGEEISAALLRLDRIDSVVLRHIAETGSSTGVFDDLRLELDARVREHREAERSSGAWRPTASRLRIPVGLPRLQEIEPSMADFLVRFDGRSTVRELIQLLAAQIEQPADHVQSECERVIHRLLERGFLDFTEP